METRNFRAWVSELVGTYLLVVIGPGTVVLLSVLTISGPEALALVALFFGGTVALVIFLFGEFSGAVINPALTLAAFSAKQLSGGLVVPFLTFQIIAGVLGGYTLKLVFGTLGDSTSLGSTKLAAGVSPPMGIAIEAAGTLVLASSALLASVRIRKRSRQAVFVGGTLAVLILLIGPLTGASFNPARSLGPSLASGYYQNLYVYVVGPTVGALIAGITFRLIPKHR